MIRYKRKNGQAVKMTAKEIAEEERIKAMPQQPKEKTKIEKLSDLLINKKILTKAEVDKL